MMTCCVLAALALSSSSRFFSMSSTSSIVFWSASSEIFGLGPRTSLIWMISRVSFSISLSASLSTRSFFSLRICLHLTNSSLMIFSVSSSACWLVGIDHPSLSGRFAPFATIAVRIPASGAPSSNLTSPLLVLTPSSFHSPARSTGEYDEPIV